jgi:hypothetical protein
MCNVQCAMCNQCNVQSMFKYNQVVKNINNNDLINGIQSLSEKIAIVDILHAYYPDQKPTPTVISQMSQFLLTYGIAKINLDSFNKYIDSIYSNNPNGTKKITLTKSSILSTISS